MPKWAEGGALVFSLAVIAYLMGWLYLNEYYATFGVSLHMLNAPLEHYLVHGFGVLVSWSRDRTVTGWVLLILFAFCLVLALIKVPRFGGVRSMLIAVLLPTILIIAFLVARERGGGDADAVARGSAGQRAFLALVPSFVESLSLRRDPLATVNQEGNLRLVFQDEASTYVVVPNSAYGTRDARGQVVTVQTYRIPNDVIEYTVRLGATREGG